MVTPEYVRFLVRVANDKMEANRKRTERFHALLLQSNSNGSQTGLVCDHLQLDDESQLANGNAETNSGIFVDNEFC